jgi:hypothetical protein
MKRLSVSGLLILALVISWLASLHLRAQPQPVFLRLKGVANVTNFIGLCRDMQVVGNRAYLAWLHDDWINTNYSGGLKIFNVTNPAAPLHLGSYETRLPVNAISVAGHYAYLALGTARTFTNDPGAFEIIDVSNSTNPVRVGGVDTRSRANAIRVLGNYAYVAESTRWTGSNLLGALEIFDVSTPTNPVRVATFDTAGAVTSVDVSGSHAYFADGVTDLQVLDVSDPANPKRVGEYFSDVLHNTCGWEPGGPAKFVQVVGNLAYSYGGNGLHVLDISDPSHPTSINDAFCHPAYSLHVSEHYAGATVFVSGEGAFRVAILDVSQPANVVQVGAKFPWPPVFRIVGNFIYAAANPLSVYEFSNQPAITSLTIDSEWVSLKWESAPGFVLQRTSSLEQPVWSEVPVDEGQNSIVMPHTNSIEFFRLTKP